MIAVENLHRRFDQVVAVDGVSFEVSTGEVFGLVGPNGAGKTTTINMIVGVLKPDEGEIRINGGTDPTRADVRSGIGYAPQSVAIYDPLTATENLTFFARLYGLTGARLKERVAWALKFSGLEEKAKSRVGTFSGGMKRRLNLAAALAHDPPVIILDEPTVGVDPQSRNLIFESIEHLKSEGRTIIYTTHYMEEAQRLCDRVAIIDHGKILALDTVEKLIQAYGGVSIVDVELDEIPVNIKALPGTLEGRRLRVESERPMEVLAALSAAKVNFSDLKIERPNLEKVFLNLTGRRLRD